MRGEVIGYIWICQSKNKREEIWSPMACGDSAHELLVGDMLLLDQGATMFGSKQEAKNALNDTMKRAKAAGHTWMSKYTYSVVEVYSHVVDAK